MKEKIRSFTIFRRRKRLLRLRDERYPKNCKKQLFQEMKARYKEDDEIYLIFFNEYWYVVKFQKRKRISIVLQTF